MNERILISGASIAGLTLAHWLARHGFQPAVVESGRGPRPGGNGVDVRDQAIGVVERMGILPEIRAAATDVRGMKFVDARDRAVARIGTQDSGGVELMRGDLVALLHRQTDIAFPAYHAGHRALVDKKPRRAGRARRASGART